MQEADALCDRLAILDKGKIILEGTSLELKEDYANRHGLAALPTLEDVFMEATGHGLDQEDEDNEDTEGGGP
jgi:ABC-2 type transport system ATP-binding protein